MRPALGCLCFIIVVFSNSILLDAWTLSSGAPQHGEHDFRDIRSGQYVSMFIHNQGAYAGHLLRVPANPADWYDVPHRMYVQLPRNRRYFADLKPLVILPEDRLTDSLYYIDIGKTYVVSSQLLRSPPVNRQHHPDPARVTIILHNHPERGPWHLTLYANVAYFNGPVADWQDPVRYATIVEERNQQGIAGYQQFHNHQDNHGNNPSNPNPEAEQKYWGFLRKYK